MNFWKQSSIATALVSAAVFGNAAELGEAPAFADASSEYHPARGTTAMIADACCGDAAVPGAREHTDKLEIHRSVIAAGDSDWDWTQARVAFIPSPNKRLAIATMSRTAKFGAHGYHDVFAVFGDADTDRWTQPTVVPSLRRTRQDDGYEVVAGDLCPIWHRPSGKVLISGKTFNFAGGTKENILREQVAYCVFDPVSREFGPMRTMNMPTQDHAGHPIIAPNAGCHQQVVLDDGTVLIPVRYQRSKIKRIYVSIVARCRFDGTTLTYLDHGTEHSIPRGRGLYEPSITVHDGSYYLTMRADDGAWVARSSDGTNYSEPVPWKFDDGRVLGSYNTQQHWVTLGNRLYLVYTRRGADNDHIMRHRAPLFVGQVDPRRLVVIKDSEQIVVPENHATLGNSGVCRISNNESWVAVAEGRVSLGKRKGENNRVILAKLYLEE